MAGGEDSSSSVNTVCPLYKTSKPLPTTVRTDKDWGGEGQSSNNVLEVDSSFSDPEFWFRDPNFFADVTDSTLSMMNQYELIPSNVTTSNVGSYSNPPQPPRSVNEKSSQGALHDIWLGDPNFIADVINTTLSMMNQDKLIPSIVTTSNVGSYSNPPQPPRSVNEKSSQGALPKEMLSNGMITDPSNNTIQFSYSESDEDEILSSESDRVETSSEPTVRLSEGNGEVKSGVPEIGMTFSCEKEAYEFYQKYADQNGFKVRKGKVARSSNGDLKKRYFFCSKEGFRLQKQPAKLTNYTRKETRTGCDAMIQITFENGKCRISHFKPEHNHGPQDCSKIPKADSLIAEAGACARFSDMNYSQHLRDKKMNSLQPKDVQGLIDYFKKLQLEDPSLFYTFQVDAEGHMTNIFWRDGRSKIDYDYFGDVLILDTTFKTNRYNMICAPFLGLNHHQQEVLFGCAFLLDESAESFTWLLRTFMEVMGSRQPKTIFTTECPAISEAVEARLPKSQHRFCKKFVCRNAKQHLSMYYKQPEFERHFHSCLFDCQSEVEFQSKWSLLLEQYNLHENPWLQNMYTLRAKWSYLFSKLTFCAGIHSIQGIENFSNANVFQNRESEAMTLLEYVQTYEKAAEQQRRQELHEDFSCSASKPELTVNSPTEEQAANVYTATMFKIFQRELFGSMSVPLKRMTKKGTIVTYKVTKGEKTESKVEFNSLDSTIRCSCKKFESVGILCAHALKVLNTRNIFQIPQQYILKRWTKSAKDGVEDEEIADNSDRLCRSKFMHKTLKFITKSAELEETQKIVERSMDRDSKKVDDVLKKGKEHLNTNHENFCNTNHVASLAGKEKVGKDLYLNQRETSKGTTEPQRQKKRKNEVREKMDPSSSSMSLP